MKYFIPRWYRRNLESALRVLPVTVLTGARQTGKTTLVKSLGPIRTYLTLDDLGVMDQAKRNPHSLLGSHPLTFDEIQRAPSLLLAIKQAVDEQRSAGNYVLTGSANLILLDEISDTLAGRAVYLDLPPFCPAEWQQRQEALQPLDRLFAADFDLREWPIDHGHWHPWLLRGGFPPALAIAEDADRALWFSAYVQTYLERDLRQLSAVSSLPDFQRLMSLAAHRTSRLINQADLARDAALSHPTTHRYLNLLETGNLIARIRPFATNPTTALVKAPKLFWTDCGLAAALAGIRNPTDIANRPDAGFWLEQTLYQTFQSWRAMDPLNRKIHYWRDRAGREVDFILEQRGELVAVEVKNASLVSSADAAGILAFREVLKQQSHLVRSVVLHAGQARQLDTKLLALPWGWMVATKEAK